MRITTEQQAVGWSRRRKSSVSVPADKAGQEANEPTHASYWRLGDARYCTLEAAKRPIRARPFTVGSHSLAVPFAQPTYSAISLLYALCDALRLHGVPAFLLH